MNGVCFCIDLNRNFTCTLIYIFAERILIVLKQMIPRRSWQHMGSLMCSEYNRYNCLIEIMP